MYSLASWYPSSMFAGHLARYIIIHIRHLVIYLQQGGSTISAYLTSEVFCSLGRCRSLQGICWNRTRTLLPFASDDATANFCWAIFFPDAPPTLVNILGPARSHRPDRCLLFRRSLWRYLRWICMPLSVGLSSWRQRGNARSFWRNSETAGRSSTWTGRDRQ